MARKTLPRLSSLCFEHPSDQAALKALKNTAGFDRMVRFIMGMGLEPVVDYQNRSKFVRCDEQQCAPLYALYTEAVSVLDIDPVPPLFLAHSPAVNAWTFGSERPYVVVTSALVEGFEDPEIQCVMGHELGHILAGHSLYRTVGAILMSLLRVGMSVAGAVVALPAWLLSRGLLSAYLYWARCAELTADRAGLIVAQDPAIAFSTETKLASGPGKKVAAMLNVERFLEQAREFEEDPTLNNKLVRFLLQDQLTHPYPAVRVREMEKWIEAGELARILGGDYTRRPHARIAGDALQGAEGNGRQQAIEDVIQTSLSRVFGVETAPKINETKLLRAVDEFAPCDEGESVVAFYDGGLDRSDALVLTTSHLYSAKRPQVPLPYERLLEVRAHSAGLLRAPALRVGLGEEEEALTLTFHRSEIRDGILDALEGAGRVTREQL